MHPQKKAAESAPRPAVWPRGALFVVVSALALTATGCATTGVVQTGQTTAAKPANCALEVYASRADIKRPYRSVCIVSSESGRTLFNDRSDAGRLQAAKEQACACGADAIVIRDMSRSATQLGVGYSQSRISVEAISYMGGEGDAPAGGAPR
jgi:hypothetical protein